MRKSILRLLIGLTFLASTVSIASELSKDHLGIYVIQSGDSDCVQSISISRSEAGEYTLDPFYAGGGKERSFDNGLDRTYKAGNMAPPVVDTYKINENKIQMNIVQVDSMAAEYGEIDIILVFKKDGSLKYSMDSSFKGIYNIAYLWGADDGKEINCNYKKH